MPVGGKLVLKGGLKVTSSGVEKTKKKKKKHGGASAEEQQQQQEAQSEYLGKSGFTPAPATIYLSNH